MERIDAVVSGRVQGVMYRDHIERHALALSLTGYVENLPNGNVRIVATGTREHLEKLIAYAEKGSLFSEVTGVQVMWSAPTGPFTHFRIKRHGE